MAHAQTLHVEVSAEASVRERLVGQLIDLPITLSEQRRPDADPASLFEGEEELCIFLRTHEGLTLGLIDRRAARSLVERTQIAGEGSVSVETAALQARQWIQELLRGGTLGVAPELEASAPAPAASSASSSEPPPSPPAPPENATVDLPPRSLRQFHIDGGWQMLGVGSDRPFQGAWISVGAGRRGTWMWALGLRASFGAPQRWRQDDVGIEHARLRASVWAEGARRLGNAELGLRAQVGALSEHRQTVEPGAGRRATPARWRTSAFLATSLVLRLHVHSQLGVVVRSGAELGLDRSVFQAEDGPRFSTWRVRPTLELGFFATWPRGR